MSGRILTSMFVTLGLVNFAHADDVLFNGYFNGPKRLPPLQDALHQILEAAPGASIVKKSLSHHRGCDMVCFDDLVLTAWMSDGKVCRRVVSKYMLDAPADCQ